MFDTIKDKFQSHNEEFTTYSQEPEKHKAHLSHELIAGAATFEAMKAYNEHCRKEGKPQSHEKAKEVFASLLGGAVDKIVETKGLDFIDKQKANHHAKENSREAEEHLAYGN